MLLLQFSDDRKHALQLFVSIYGSIYGSTHGWGTHPGLEIRSRNFGHLGRHNPCWPRRTRIHPRSGTRGLAANIKDVGPLIQQSLRMFDGLLAFQELAAVGKRIWSDVDDAHDQSALAELQDAPPQAPLKDGSHAARF